MTYFTEFYPAQAASGIEGTTVVSSVSRTMELKLYKWASAMPTTHLPLGRSTINWDTNVYTVPGDNRFILMIGGVEISPASIVYTIDYDVLNGLTVDVDAQGNIITSGDNWTTDSETFNITATYSGTPYTLAYTVRKAKVGVSTILTDLLYTTDTVAAAADGTGYVLPLENKLIVRSNGTILTSGVTYSGDATQNGLTLSINSEGDIYLSGDTWTTDSETFVLTATYAATPYTISYTVRKSKTGTSTAFYNIVHNRATALASSDGVDYTIPYSANGWALSPPTAVFGSNLYKVVLITTGNNADPVSTIDWDANYTIEYAAQALESSIIAELSNPMHIFPATRGAPGHYVVNTYADSGTTIQVWEGLTELTYDGVGTDAGTWTVTAEANIHIDIGTITADSGHAVVPDFTNYDDTWSDTTIVYNIAGTTSTGTPFTGVKTQRFSKSTNIGIYELEISSPVISKQSESAIVSGSHSTLEITGKHKEGEYSEYWGWLTITPNGGVRGAAIDLAAYALANPLAPNVLLHSADGDTISDYLIELWTGDPDVVGPSVETVKDSILVPVIYKGSPGTRTVSLKLYKWLDDAPSTYPSGPSVYTWATASFTTGSMTLNGWSTSIPAPAHGGMTLYSVTKIIVDTTSDLTTNITWSGTTAESLSTSAIGGVSALLSNETHNFNADSSGAVSVFTNSGTDITVSEGSTLLTYGAFTPGYPGSNGTWNLYYGVSGITGVGSVSGAGGTTATIGNVTGVTTGNDAPYITWYIYGKTASGNTFFFTKNQTFTKIKNPLRYELALSSYSITKQAPDAATSGTYSSFTAYGYKYDGSTKSNFGWVTFQADNGSESARSAVGSGVTSTPASGSGAASYTVRLYDAASGGNLIDTKFVGVVFKGTAGTAGSNAVYVEFSNPAVNVQANYAGTVSSYTNTGTIIKVYEDGALLDYDASGATNGKWNVTASGTNITAGTKSSTGTIPNRYVTYGVANTMSSDTASILYTISGFDSVGNPISLTMNQTFVKAKEARPILRVELSSAATTLNAYPNGTVPDYSSAQITLKLYEGDTLLDYDGTGSTAGKWNVTSSGTNITPGTKSSTGTIPNRYVSYGSPSTMTQNNGSISYTITGKYVSGDSFTGILVVQSLSKAVGAYAPISAYTNKPNISIPTDADGLNQVYTNSSGTFLYVKEGDTLLEYDGVGTANSSWTISSKSVEAGTVTYGTTATDTQSYAIINTASAMTTDTAIVRYNISGKNSYGVSFTTYIDQVFTKIKGAVIDTTAPATASNAGSFSSAIVTTPAGDIYATLSTSWTANSETDLAFYEVGIKEGVGGTYIYNTTPTNSYAWSNLKPNTTYYVIVRATDISGNTGTSSTATSYTTATDSGAPAIPTSVAATAAIKTIFLNWTNPSDSDLTGIQVFENTTNTISGTPLVTLNAKPGAKGAFTRSGITTGTTYYYWLKAIDTSGNVSAATTSVSVTPSAVGNSDITAGTINADRIVSGSIEGSMFNTSTSLPGTITVGATGVTIATVQSNADLGATNPATRINAGATTIDPGKILISGATTLSSWRAGGDNTKIDGGNIYANSITANKISIGIRGIDIADLQFEAVSASNRITWTAGTISYIDEDASSTPTTNAITISSTTYSPNAGPQWTTGTLYIYWVKGESRLRDTTSLATAYTASTVVLATYKGGVNLVATYGRTIIDGSQITTGSITASRINIDGTTITATGGGALQVNAINASQITAGTISTSRLDIDGISITNVAGSLKIGDISAATGTFSANLNVAGTAKIAGSGSNTLGKGTASLEIATTSTNIGLVVLASGNNTGAWIETASTNAAHYALIVNSPSGAGGLKVQGTLVVNDDTSLLGQLGVNSPSAAVDSNYGIISGGYTEVTGSLRSIGSSSTNVPTSGDGIEMFYKDSTDVGTIVVGDRTTAEGFLSYGNLELKAATITFKQATGIAVPATASASTPGIHFDGDTNTGIYNVAADSIGITTGGTNKVTIDTGVHLNVTTNISVSGSVSAPALYFVTDTTTGFYRGGADIIRVAAAGANIAEFNSNGVTFVKHPRLTAAAPATSSDTGSSGQIAFDATYLYVCTAGNTWKRIALTAF